jgi:hypothetical protein
MDELKRHAYCKWHNSFSHATNDCNVFRRQIQSAINEGRLAFQKMQVDKQPFPVNTIEPTCKKVMVQPEVADKGKGKNIIIGDPRTSNISQEEIARKALDRKTNKSGGARGQAQSSSRAKLPDSTIADGLALARGWSGAHTNGLADSAGQSAHVQRRQPPQKARKETQGQSTHGWLVCDPPTKKPRSPAKTKRPERQHNKHRLFIL